MRTGSMVIACVVTELFEGAALLSPPSKQAVMRFGVYDADDEQALRSGAKPFAWSNPRRLDLRTALPRHPTSALVDCIPCVAVNALTDAHVMARLAAHRPGVVRTRTPARTDFVGD